MPRPKKEVAEPVVVVPSEVVEELRKDSDGTFGVEPTQEVAEGTYTKLNAKPTGKFECVLGNPKKSHYYLMGPDGRTLSPALSKDEVDRMVMNLNNKRR